MNAVGIDLLHAAVQRPAPIPRALPAHRDHPLASSLRRISDAGGRPRASLGLGGRPLDAWAYATELADGPAPKLEQSLRRVGVHYRTADRLVMTSLFFGSYVWQLAAASLGCFLSERRVPDVSAENVAVHIGDDGRVDEVRFLGGGFAALPDDPAADHPDAVIVRDRAALRELLVRRLTAGHLEELILALQAQRGLGTRALWAAVEDRCLGALLWLAQRLGDVVDVESEAHALSRTPPFVGSSGILVMPTTGDPALALKRGFCCLAYRLDSRDRCATCPLRATGAFERHPPARTTAHQER